MVDWQKDNSNQNSAKLKIALCPSYPFLTPAKLKLQNSSISVGAQDVSEFDSGAYTSEVSAAMLVEMGCDFCIVGHSEARENLYQNDEKINKKLTQLIKSNIIPILCVGESLEIREKGKEKEFVLNQLKNSLKGLNPKELIVAYEPIWAIGTGKTATSKQANEMHEAIYDLLKSLSLKNFSVLYGGSVNQDNAKELFSMPKIDGALVGGASLKAQSFKEICGATLCLISS